MKRKTVSLCMIVRDEEAAIGPAIKSALALVDEVIVVDTGSRDNTRIIAEGYGARVIDFSWRDDFAAARNAGLDEAFGDWILVLDADERLQPVRPIEFQRLLANERVAGYRVEMVSRRTTSLVQSFRLLRLFRNHPEIRYRYPIHEQVMPALNAWAEPREMVIMDAALTVHHEGYRQERSAEKRERNLRILHKARQAYPAEPYFDYQLACESMSLLDDEVLPVAGLAAAAERLEQGWQKVLALGDDERRQLAYGPDLSARLAACQLALGRVADAVATAQAGRACFGDHVVLRLAAVSTATRAAVEATERQLMPFTEVQALIVRARRDCVALSEQASPPQAIPTDSRIWRLYPLRYLGELALLEGHVDEAAELFEKALTVDSTYSSAWLGLAECARYAGDRKRALKLYLRAVTLNEWNHRAWLRGADVLEELGFHDNAASWRRKVIMHFPDHPSCRNGEVGDDDREPSRLQPAG